MGWWSDCIMGGDTPLDVRDEFDRVFSAEPLTSAAAVAFVDRLSRQGVEPWVVRQVVGFLVMQRGGPMGHELRQVVLSGVDAEDGADFGWSDPESRSRKLAEFRRLVVDYPESGVPVEMPHQPGLLETVASWGGDS